MQYNVETSVAAVVNLSGLGYLERTPISLRRTDESPWPGSAEVTIWNSSVKNTKLIGPIPLIYPQPNVIFWDLKPEELGLKPGKYYYEYFSLEIERIIQKGNLEIDE